MAWPNKNTDTIHLNATLIEHDSGLTSQSGAPPDLWFISTPPGGLPVLVPSTYSYDRPGGKNVVVYILDPGNFDMTLPVRPPYYAGKMSVC